jgi:purine-nucleoside phosphorylase
MMSGVFIIMKDIQWKRNFPCQSFHLLGIKNLILSNACGGVNPDYSIADIVILKDHINMMPEHPLRGKIEILMSSDHVLWI